MSNKKGLFDSLIYFALLSSLLRDDFNYIRDPILSNNFIVTSASNYGQTDIYLLQTLRSTYDGLDDQIYPQSKTGILLRETVDVLQEINALGRYSRRPQFDSHLYAYLVNRDENQENGGPTEVIPPSNAGNSSNPIGVGCSSRESGTLENALPRDINSTQQSFQSAREDEVAVGVLDVQDEDDGHLKLDTISDLLEDEGYNGMAGDEDDLLFPDLSLVSDPLLSSIAHDDGDEVGSIFEELERLILDPDNMHEENVHNRLDNSAVGASWASNYDYADGNILAADGQQANYNQYYLSNGQYYAATDGGHIQESVAAPASDYIINPATSSANCETFGSTVANSLTTLTNGSEPMPDDVQVSTNYSGSRHYNHDYYGNSTLNNHPAINATTSAAFPDHPSGQGIGAVANLTDFLSPEDLQMMDVGGAVGHTPMKEEGAYLHSGQLSGYLPMDDRFDTSNDSAVSSMSPDRVPSDGDWMENSEHQNGDGFYSNNMQNFGSSPAQKKYKLFGKSSSYYMPDSYYTPSVDGYGTGYGSSNDPYSNLSSTTSSSSSSSTLINHPLYHNHTYVSLQDGAVPQVTNLPTRKPSGTSRSVSESNRSLEFSEDDEEGSLDGSGSCRDEKRAKAMRIPISILDIINLPIDEFNERLAKHELTEAQLSLIRDIRRRGKNKVAAQNCRKRKMDQILGLQGEVKDLISEKSNLEQEHWHLRMLRDLAQEKYTKLYNFILDASAAWDRKMTGNENKSEGGFNNSNAENNTENSSYHRKEY